jgi:hypothetical protein
LLGGGGGLVLGFEGVEEGLEVGLAFAGEDQGLGGESVLEGCLTVLGARLGSSNPI